MDESKYACVRDTYNKEDLLFDKVGVMSACLTDQSYYFKQKGIELNKQVCDPAPLENYMPGQICYISRF